MRNSGFEKNSRIFLNQVNPPKRSCINQLIFLQVLASVDVSGSPLTTVNRSDIFLMNEHIGEECRKPRVKAMNAISLICLALCWHQFAVTDQRFIHSFAGLELWAFSFELSMSEVQLQFRVQLLSPSFHRVNHPNPTGQLGNWCLTRKR